MVVLKQAVYLIVVKVSNVVSAALYLISRLRFCKNLALNRGSLRLLYASVVEGKLMTVHHVSF